MTSQSDLIDKKFKEIDEQIDKTSKHLNDGIDILSASLAQHENRRDQLESCVPKLRKLNILRKIEHKCCSMK
jgi:predicted RNase H-like nuclease (RuvC/YqgF family)